MFQYKKTVPGDPTILPGMHTILADRGQSYQVNYIKDVEYVQRDGKPLHLQLLLPGGLLPGMESTLRYPLVVYVQGSAWGEQYVYGSLPQLVPLARAGFVVASVKHRPLLSGAVSRLFAGREVGDPVPAGQRGEVFHRSQPGGDLGRFLRRPRRPDGGRHRGHGGI